LLDSVTLSTLQTNSIDKACTHLFLVGTRP
jgi:hypothetical protein